MIGPIPRRLAALLAALAFGLALAEGVLAGACGPEAELQRCGEEMMVHLPAETDPGDEAPAPCPFTPMGSGSCHAVSFPAPALAQLPSPPDGTWNLETSTPIRDLPAAAPPYQPPRA